MMRGGIEYRNKHFIIIIIDERMTGLVKVIQNICQQKAYIRNGK